MLHKSRSTDVVTTDGELGDLQSPTTEYSISAGDDLAAESRCGQTWDEDLLSCYLADVQRQPQLTLQEERTLIAARAHAVEQATAGVQKIIACIAEQQRPEAVYDAVAQALRTSRGDLARFQIEGVDVDTSNSSLADLVRDTSQALSTADQARNRLIEANLEVVVRLARSYSCDNFALLELIKTGNEGLWDAVETCAGDDSQCIAERAIPRVQRALEQAIAERRQHRAMYRQR